MPSQYNRSECCSQPHTKKFTVLESCIPFSNLARPEVIGGFAQGISRLCEQADPATLDLRKQIIEGNHIHRLVCESSVFSGCFLHTVQILSVGH